MCHARAMTLRLGLAWSLALAVPSIASADAVGPPDPSVVCPRGAEVETNHCGTVCVARRCASDAQCRPGEVCEAGVSACAADEPYCGGWTMDLYERIHGACAGGCAIGECRTFAACVPASPRPDAGTAGADAGTGTVVTYGCGCRAHGAPAGPLALVTLALVALGLRRRPGGSQ